MSNNAQASSTPGAQAQQQKQQQQQQPPQSPADKDKDPVDRMETRMRGLFSDFKSQLYQVKDNYQKTGSLMPSSSQQQPGGYGVSDSGSAGAQGSASSSALWGPQVDVLETEKDFLIIADLPGVKRDDLVVEVHDRNLFLSGETRQQQVYTQQGVQARVTERRYGKFSRTIVLAKAVDQDNVNARFEDGVLEIRLPKVVQQQTTGVRIPIQGITGMGQGTQQQQPYQQGGQQGQQGQQPYQQGGQQGQQPYQQGDQQGQSGQQAYQQDSQQHQQAYQQGGQQGQHQQAYQQGGQQGQSGQQPYQQQQGYQPQQESYPPQGYQQSQQQPQQSQQPPASASNAGGAPATGSNPPPYAVGDVKQ